MRQLVLVALLCFAARAMGQVAFTQGGGNWASADGTPLSGGGAWNTVDCDAGTLSCSTTGQTLSMGVAEIDAADIPHLCPTNGNCSSITGNWSFSTGVPTFGAGAVLGDGTSSPRYLKIDGGATVDSQLGYNSGAAGLLYVTTGIGLSNCSATDCSTGGTSSGITWYDNTGIAKDSLTHSYSTGNLNYVSASTASSVLSVATATNLAATKISTYGADPTCTGATCTASSLIPAGCMLQLVTAKALVNDGNCTSYDIGDGSTAGFWVATWDKTGTKKAPGAGAAGTTSKYYAAAANVVLTCNGGSFAASAARARFAVHCVEATEPQ